MLVWGGRDETQAFNNGARYEPAADQWLPLASANAPAGRFQHQAVWTGSEMIVWGGRDKDGEPVFEGGRYDPVSNTWRPLGQSSELGNLSLAPAVWTGGEWILWGGYDPMSGDWVANGARYDAILNSWTTLPTAGAPSRRWPMVAWTGQELLVLGGTDRAGLRTEMHAYVVFQNQPPLLDAIADVTMNQDDPAKTLNLTGITTGSATELQTLKVTATSDNAALVANPTVTYTSPNATGTLKFQPLPNAKGTAKVTVMVKDDGGTANGGVDTFTRQFTITVKSVTIDEPIEKPTEFVFYGTPEITSSPALGLAGDILFGSSSHKFFAARPDYTTHWILTLPDVIYAAPSVGVDGTIYVGSYQPVDGTEKAALFAITPDGKKLWTYEVVGKADETVRIEAPVAIAKDGTIYLAASPSGNSGRLIALSPEGKELWTVTFDGELIKAPVIGLDGTIYIGSANETFSALMPNGVIKWRYPVGALVTSSPAIGASGEIYFGARNGLHAVTSQGQQLWYFPGDGAVYSSPAIGEEGTVYFGTEKGSFFALTAEGNEKWKSPFRAKAGIFSSPAIGADGSIYFGSRGGESLDGQGVFYALEPDGRPRWDMKMTEYRPPPDSGGSPNYVDASPVISPGGILYFCAVDARLGAVDIGTPLATSPWPM